MNFTLHHYWRSTTSWRVRWALAHKGLKYRPVHINLLKNEQRDPKYLAQNPMGQVPTLEIEENGSIRRIVDSTAICEWLEESFPSAPLLPRSADDRALVRQFCQIIASGTHPVQNLETRKLFSSDPTKQIEWASYWIRKGLGAYEKRARETAGSFTVGGELSLADVYLVPQLYNARRADIDINDYPTLKRIWSSAEKTEGYQASEPSRFEPK